MEKAKPTPEKNVLSTTTNETLENIKCTVVSLVTRLLS
jgi:hypothetical protein